VAFRAIDTSQAQPHPSLPVEPRPIQASRREVSLWMGFWKNKFDASRSSKLSSSSSSASSSSTAKRESLRHGDDVPQTRCGHTIDERQPPPPGATHLQSSFSRTASGSRRSDSTRASVISIRSGADRNRVWSSVRTHRPSSEPYSKCSSSPRPYPRAVCQQRPVKLTTQWDFRDTTWPVWASTTPSCLVCKTVAQPSSNKSHVQESSQHMLYGHLVQQHTAHDCGCVLLLAAAQGLD